MQIRPDSLAYTHPFEVERRQQAAMKSLDNSFVDLMAKGVQGVNDQQMQANDMVDQLLSGGEINSAEVLTGLQKADMSFRLLVQIRNKLMRAYEELNNIRV